MVCPVGVAEIIHTHERIALIVNGETHPFEPFWDIDRWKYKEIYNNKSLGYYGVNLTYQSFSAALFAIHLRWSPIADKI